MKLYLSHGAAAFAMQYL